MLATQAEIDSLAERIKRAYLLRQPQWNPGCSAAGVWAVAASTLLQIHSDDPSIPVDPELYVAAQAKGPTFVDPWAELTQTIAARRYRKRVRWIIASLRKELRGEIRLAGRRIDRGEGVATVLLTRSPSLSPLGRFIAARTAGLNDLAERLQAEAAQQHRMCPLYRQACRSLLPPEWYPVPDTSGDARFAVPDLLVGRRAARS